MNENDNQIYCREIELKGYNYCLTLNGKTKVITIKAFNKDNKNVIPLTLSCGLNKKNKLDITIFISDKGSMYFTKSYLTYNDEKFELETEDDKVKATRVLLLENYEILKPITDIIILFEDKFPVVSYLKNELKESKKDKGIIEYINMKKDPNIKKLLKEMEEEA